MSKPREKWWGYVKACIREYPATYKELETARQEAAVPKSPSFASVFLPVSSCLDMLWLTLSLRVFDMPRVKPVL